MGNPAKESRNKEIVQKHERGWSFGRLSKFYNLSRPSVHEIYHRDKEKYGVKYLPQKEYVRSYPQPGLTLRN